VPFPDLGMSLNCIRVVRESPYDFRPAIDGMARNLSLVMVPQFELDAGRTVSALVRLGMSPNTRGWQADPRVGRIKQ